MKSVLASFKPQYCELIASGRKTVELCKNRPKLDTPFKVYMYCTNSGKPLVYGSPVPTYVEENLVTTSGYSREKAERIFGCWNGKVIGEFVCDEIVKYEPFYDDYSEYYIDDDTLMSACLTPEESLKYGNRNPLYAWHISDLVIYDEPRELGEFYKKCNNIYGCGNHCEHWKYMRVNADEFDMDCDCGGLPPITRPPQSWCYVEEVQG